MVYNITYNLHISSYNTYIAILHWVLNIIVLIVLHLTMSFAVPAYLSKAHYVSVLSYMSGWVHTHVHAGVVAYTRAQLLQTAALLLMLPCLII